MTERGDGDWFAVDSTGRVAFFAGNEHGCIPTSAETARAAEAIEAIAAAVRERQEAALAAGAYRSSSDGATAIFDGPMSKRGRTSHENPIEGYPLLVSAVHQDVRDMAVGYGGVEQPAREGYAVLFRAIDRLTYDLLHDQDLCAGCRVLDDPSDRRPRAPEVLAAAGLYVYVHVDDDATEPYRRVAGPSVATDVRDVEPLVKALATLVKLPVRFEDTDTIQPADFLPCGVSW